MSTLAATAPDTAAPHAAPPWRALAMLAALVLAAHALVLQTSPAHYGPAPDLASRQALAFVTRRIDMPPPAEVTPPPVVAGAKSKPQAKSAGKPAGKPVANPILKEKVAVAQESREQSAIDSIAIGEPEPAAVSDPYAPDGPSGGPDPASAAAMAAASAASAAPVPPIDPGLTPPVAMALPPSTRLEYKMTGRAKGLTYYASAELVWNNAGSSYDASMTISAFLLGSRSMASSGLLGAEGLAPTRFSDKSRTEVAAHFEPDKGQISFSANTPPVPWIKGAQDRMSVFLQLGGLLAGSPASYPVGTSISMYTVGPRDADNWTFVVEAEEKLDLPYGELNTLKLARQPRREFDQKVEIWYAPALGYLPVRSKITQRNGDFVDQQLNAVSNS
ncbi:MAG: DUF3108 domain-containing protein [Polaromonas sp.]